jgi:23S rRNA pseudouridine1911/1915/1917 synthase
VSAPAPPALPDPRLAVTDDWIALSKPPGVTVFPRRSGDGPPSLLQRLLVVDPGQEQAWPEGFAGGLLHRLDTWTSGLVVAARSPDALARGRALFAEHRLRKRYAFLSARDVPWDRTVVEHPLAHDRKDRRKMVWQRGRNTPHRGKWLAARTEIVREGPHWAAIMATGVMHQIRVHAASAGLPLLGDRLYGGAPDPAGGARYYLHHHRLDGWPEPLPAVPVPEDWP